MNRNDYFRISGLLSVILLTNICAQDAPHEVINFECNVCHSSQSWADIQFDHNTTDFELVGIHAAVQCKECHQLKNFSIAESNCSSCHLDVHQAKLGILCENCHSPRGWSEINLIAVHSNTTFPLTGAHLILDCKACHISEVENEFSFLDAECYNCHQSDFNNNPNAVHSAMGIGTDCQQCHTTSAWQPAGFRDHDRLFPIFSGKHAGEWTSCNDCHLNPGNFQIFSCLNCHEHNKQDMDDKHNDVSGYVYESTACLSCHPTGEKE